MKIYSNKYDLNFLYFLYYCLFFILLLLLLFKGCSKTRDPNTIDFWSMGAEGEHIQKLMPEFEKCTGIKVKVQSIPWTAAHEKLLTAYAGNSTPDICQLGNTWVPEFVALNAIEKLNNWVDSSNVINRGNYFSGIWETNIIDSVLYGIPWYVDTRVMFYRRDLLSQVGYDKFPTTWEELLDASQKLVRSKKATYGILLPVNEWAGPVILGLQNGSSLLKDNNCYGNFSGMEFREAFDFFLTFYREKLCPLGMTQVTNIYQGFEEGYFAMLITGPWNIGEFFHRLPQDFHEKWATAPLPSPSAEKPGSSLAGGSSLVIFKKSNKKEAAWKLLEYLSEPKTQSKFYKLTGDLPARVEAWEDSAFVNNPYTKTFHLQLQHVKTTPKIPEWEQIALKVQQYVESAGYEELSADDALKALDCDINVILEKRRWLLGIADK